MKLQAEKNSTVKNPVRVVVVEDENWMRENLFRAINSSPGMCCVNHYRRAEDALEGISRDEPDVVLMDINLPGMDGVECVRRIRTLLPEVRYLMLTVYEESEKI